MTQGTLLETNGHVAAPASHRLEVRVDGQLELVSPDGSRTAVRAVRCFPWSHPASFFSLRDDDDKEVLLLSDPAELDAESRANLEEALARVGFVLVVTAIHSVSEEYELRLWSVETEQGPRKFQTARDAWPRELPGGGVLIRDVAGDLYFVPDPTKLDQKSQHLLWAFVD
jgi:hypothetical protein